jgi:hypothetical protein
MVEPANRLAYRIASPGGKMKSETIPVQQVFQDRRQYLVPFYQRAYVWNKDDRWEPLWNDVAEKAEGTKPDGMAGYSRYPGGGATQSRSSAQPRRGVN